MVNIYYVYPMPSLSRRDSGGGMVLSPGRPDVSLESALIGSRHDPTLTYTYVTRRHEHLQTYSLPDHAQAPRLIWREQRTNQLIPI